jgi:ZIP family zinc transporter
MGFGSGVLISAVSFELVDEAVSVSGGRGGAGAGFFIGALTYFAGDTTIAALGRRHGGNANSGLSIVLGATLDGIPESVVIGLTLLAGGGVGVAMLVAVFMSNLPESIAATTDLLESGWRPLRLYAMWGAIALASAVAAAVGYRLFDGATPAVIAFVLSFAGGAILTMLSTSMMPEGYEHAGRVVGLATTLGFAVAYGINWASA